MRASNTYNSSGSKATKIAIVTALHVGVALAFMNMKIMTPVLPPVMVGPVTPPKVDIPPPPKPVEVDMTTAKLEPRIYVPETEVVTHAPPPEVAPLAKTLPPGPPPTVTNGGGGTGLIDEPVRPEVKKVAFTPATSGDCARPDYPASAARNGDTGTVGLALLIGADGKVADARIERSSGSKALDRAAVAALSMCKFKPATSNGVAEPAWGKIAYVWTLD